MKKYLIIIFILFFCYGAYAQELKLFGGANFSKYTEKYVPPWVMSADYNPFHDSKMGFLAGGGIELVINKNIAFEMDALFVQKGSNFSYLNNEKFKYSLNVLSFPIILKLYLIPNFPFYLLEGYEYSIILSHEKIFIANGQEVSKENIKPKTKSYDQGVVFGLGFKQKLPSGSLIIEARYNLGLRNLSKDYRDYPSIKTSAAGILFGFTI
jgi:hypothetical protein